MEQTSTHLNVDDFCKAIASELMAQNRDRLPFDGPDIAKAMNDIAAEVLRTARKAFDQGNKRLGEDLLTILDDVAPNPNTGAFDRLWGALRALQPGRAGVHNPRYEQIHFKSAPLGQRLESESIDPLWQKLVSASADHILRQL